MNQARGNVNVIAIHQHAHVEGDEGISSKGLAINETERVHLVGGGGEFNIPEESSRFGVENVNNVVVAAPNDGVVIPSDSLHVIGPCVVVSAPFGCNWIAEVEFSGHCVVLFVQRNCSEGEERRGEERRGEERRGEERRGEERRGEERRKEKKRKPG